VRSGLQPALAAEGDRQEGHRPFLHLSGAADFAQFFLNWARAAFNLRATTAPLFGARLGV